MPNTFYLKAALSYAKRGIPVFPCESGGKVPRTRRGFKDATTDARTIHMWWTRWPQANIGVPTGERSGFWALDVDPEAGGLESFKALNLTLGRAHVLTGGGGLHYFFATTPGVAIRNNAGRLGPGLDVRGEGGFIIAPPSVTEGPYRTLERRAPIAPPAALLEALREPQTGDSGGAHGIRPPVDPEDGAPIPEGERNHTLARIAGRLHDGSRSLAELAADLMQINLARCTPPLPELEVRRIAKSIHGRGPCTPGPGPEARKRLGEIERAAFDAHWPGMAGKTERDTIIAVIKTARKHCRELPDGGLEVSLDVRSLALAAAISKASLTRRGGALDRLAQAGWLRRGLAGRGTRAGTFVLSAPRAHLTHSVHPQSPPRASGSTLRAPRLRWSCVTRDWVGGDYQTFVILRLGKTSGAVIDVLEALGGSARIGEIARILGTKRPRDMRRRALARLEDRGIVTVSGDTVSLVADWIAALDREREASGEIEAFKRDLTRYNLERVAYRAARDRGELLTKEERCERARARGEERRGARRAAWEARRRLIREADRAAPNAKLWAERREGLAL